MDRTDSERTTYWAHKGRQALPLQEVRARPSWVPQGREWAKPRAPPKKCVVWKHMISLGPRCTGIW